MNIINLTPHDVNLLLEDDVIVFKSKGIARVQQKEVLDEYFDRVPIYKNKYGKIEGLPEEEKDGIYYIVSFVVASALKDKRNDLLIVTKIERNEKGQIIGCYGFARL